MNPPTKSTSLQAYRLILYRRALHPELFKVKGRRAFNHDGYDFEAWIMPGSHLMRFQHDGVCATELITDQEDGIPDRGVIAVIPCAGERDHDQDFGEKVTFTCTMQTETLPDNLYTATYDELTAFGKENDALMYTWKDEDGGKCATILDVQRYRREIHAQAYHLMAQGGLVLRTQSIFEHSE
ncbi:MAG TPA: hypothetical protein VG797_06455 [Phycisphaerales bacterium]|nr:hypothetical protein [Phycisphaerales bacterium]